MKEDFEVNDFDEDLEIVLTLEDDTEVVCHVITVFSVDDPKLSDHEYVALEVDDSCDVLLYGYKEDEDGEFELIPIEDDLEMEKVSEAFESLFEHECGCGCGCGEHHHDHDHEHHHHHEHHEHEHHHHHHDGGCSCGCE